MANKTVGESKKPVARKKSISSRALAYTILSGIGGLTKAEARKRVGLHPDTRVERSKAYANIQDRIEAACDVVGVSVEANAATLGEIAYNRDNAAPERVSAVREINNMVGWHAPQQVEVQHQTTNVAILIQAAREQGVSVGQLIKQIGRQ